MTFGAPRDTSGNSKRNQGDIFAGNMQMQKGRGTILSTALREMLFSSKTTEYIVGNKDSIFSEQNITFLMYQIITIYSKG